MRAIILFGFLMPFCALSQVQTRFFVGGSNVEVKQGSPFDLLRYFRTGGSSLEQAGGFPFGSQNPQGIVPSPWFFGVPGGQITSWIPRQVALGPNHVFSHSQNGHTAAFRIPLEGGPTPDWIYTHGFDEGMDVASAEEADVQVAITEIFTTSSPIDPRQVQLKKYDSDGLSWAYLHPHLTTIPGYTSQIEISSDGQTIVATFPSPSQTEILVFGPESNVPLRSFSFPSGAVWDLALSENGEFAILSLNMSVYVIETRTGGILFESFENYNLGAVGLAISEDGRTFAYALNSSSGTSGIWVYRWDGARYSFLHYEWAHIPLAITRAVDLSDDGNILAWGASQEYPSTLVHIGSLDLQSDTLRINEMLDEPSPFQNVVMDVELSSSGHRLAAALLGDGQPDGVEEVRVFGLSGLIRTLQLPGSAWSIDISEDGRWVSSGSKSVHANVLGSGGRVDAVFVP